VTERYAEADARVRLRAEERRAAEERVARQLTQRIEQLIERATARAAAEDLTLREADRLMRELRAALEAPHAREREQPALAERLKAAQAVLGPKVHDLRELDEWKRFANAAVQEELIARTEALRAKYGFETPEGVKQEDLDKVARELHEIQERWKQAAEAPRAQAQALWHRYRQAADPVQAKVREFFAQRVEERKGNLGRKVALIERAEALAESSDWIRTADELKKLQAEWQQIGPAPRQDTRATWKRFREACDAFFTRRNADLALRKEAWSVNLAQKEALCARAEALASSMEWEKAAAEIRRLQVEWKSVGPVRRTKSEALWQRFRLACDTFFDRYKRRDQIELEAKQADREALVTELESLVSADRSDAAVMHSPEVGTDIAPAPEGTENAALLEQVRSLRSRWNQSSPTVRHGADPLSARFMGALERLLAAYPEAFRGTELDSEANRRKMETLVERVEDFLGDGAAAPASSSQALAAMLREALASNTIGGRAGEESKWRAMAEDVRHAQAAWARLGPVPGEAGRQLADRFHRACSRFFDQFRRHVPQTTQPQAHRGKPVGAR
jgi:DNA polymerase III psi subunit